MMPSVALSPHRKSLSDTYFSTDCALPLPVILLLNSYVAQVGAVLSEYALAFFEAYPLLVVDLQKELLELVNNRTAVTKGREEFFIHVVWLLGECVPPAIFAVHPLDLCPLLPMAPWARPPKWHRDR
jgi:hypothetical protein